MNLRDRTAARNLERCQICGSTDWLPLPNPTIGRAITTAGRIISESLGKAHCRSCGVVQRTRASFLGDTQYYEQDYATYYERPGAQPFHAERYRVMVEWMATVIGSHMPMRILDVGCGQGWAMTAMRASYPHAIIEGLEPSSYNSDIARRRGFSVFEGRAGSIPIQARYDLVYSNNVLQHVTDARHFLSSLKDAATADGIIVITCPDGRFPNIELLWADQNFSFLPEHLGRLSADLGFSAIHWHASPPSAALPPAQLLLLQNAPSSHPRESHNEIPVSDLAAVHRSRHRYLESFPLIDRFLCDTIEDSRRVFNLGASYWSSILAAYCPQYWQSVDACLVDGADSGDQTFFGKHILTPESISPADDDALVFGTSPATHKMLKARYLERWKRVICWDQFLQQ